MYGLLGIGLNGGAVSLISSYLVRINEGKLVLEYGFREYLEQTMDAKSYVYPLVLSHI